MSSAQIGEVIAIALVVAAAFSSVWVIRDASLRNIPRRKALTWAVLQWIEFPLFLWLYRRARPKGVRSRSRPVTPRA
jgi:hypothetical protein